MKRQNCEIAATSGASLVVTTQASDLYGAFLYASAAAATLTIKDGTRTILAWSGAAGDDFPVIIPAPAACTSGISVTNSGAGTYTIFYAKRP